MKRGMGGGALRGPVAPTRQRRTIRFVQLLLILTAVAVFLFAGFVFARREGGSASPGPDLRAPRHPSVVQPVALIVIGLVALGTARALSDGPSVRVPTPARLDELAGRAELVAIERAAD